jgi:hypothetical protein
MLIWVPTAEVAGGLDKLPGADVEVVAPDGAALPPSADRVEFYVPPFFPGHPGSRRCARCRGWPWCRR